ncbi:U32 family peptidase, partial [bacterium]|nr:U32 family peptidase [bacterium]
MPAPEILAPAGNAEMLRAAVFAGADAVYLGLDGYNARRSAGNFTPQALREAVCFCHARGVAVHVTLNTLVYGDELEGLAGAVRAIAGAGADAVILDDLAAAALVRAIAPDLRLHGSTQMSIHTPEGAKMLAKLGYSRAILARELSLAEIRDIVRQSPIECEVFIHGAMCMSMSGQCMMSAFLGGRSGNRGDCAGPCRLPFDAGGNLRPGQPGTACHLSLKDMDLIPHMAELQAAGVASVKIEGRLRTPEYAAAAVAACRAAREGRPYDEALVRDIFSRSGFSDGYLTGRSGKAMFGVRTEADAAATRAATPKARELFRRELQRVPVWYTVSGGVEDGGIKLTAADADGRKISVYSADEPQPAQKDPMPGIERALGKTGGTPFLMAGLTAEAGEGGLGFLPGSAWNEMRREALDKLLEKRSAPTPHVVQPFTVPTYPAHTVGQLPALAARFANAAQCPADAVDKLKYLIFPLAEA